MRSYTTGRNLAGIWTKNTASANLTYLDGVANDFYKKICALKDWPFLHRTRTLSTTASTQFANLPYDVDLIEEISVVPTGSTTRYVPKLSPSRAHWDSLNLSTFTSDIPEWYFVYAGQLGLWPTPASTGNTITISAKVRPIDLSIADLTSSTITTLANASTALTVNAGLTVQMAGFWIRPTFSTTANTGDGQWYELSSVTNSTTATLVRAYGGQSISGGTAACTISQMPLLPEAFHDTPWKYAAYDYWNKEMDKRANEFKQAVADDLKALGIGYSAPTTDMVIDPGGPHQPIINPNLTISL